MPDFTLIALSIYMFGCFWWVFRTSQAMVKEFGWPILMAIGLFFALSFLWPIARCRKEQEGDILIDRIFA